MIKMTKEQLQKIKDEIDTMTEQEKQTLLDFICSAKT